MRSTGRAAWTCVPGYGGPGDGPVRTRAPSTAHRPAGAAAATSGDNPDAPRSPGTDNGCMRFLGHIIVTGLALWVTALLLPGMHLGDDSASTLTQVLTIGAIALILALVNTIVKPILEFLTFPITCVTLGLFQLVINTLMLLLASWVTGLLGLTLTFDSFWWALGAGVILGILSAIVEGITGLGDTRRERSYSAGE